MTRPDWDTKMCPEGTDPCSTLTSLDNTLCYPKSEHDEVCPITDVHFEAGVHFSNTTNHTQVSNITNLSHATNATNAINSTHAANATNASHTNVTNNSTVTNSTSRHLKEWNDSTVINGL